MSDLKKYIKKRKEQDKEFANGYMREEYDFSNSVKNPYAQKEKKQISINIEVDTIEYFKILAKKVDIPYQNLINSYLSDCAQRMLEPKLQWG